MSYLIAILLTTGALVWLLVIGAIFSAAMWYLIQQFYNRCDTGD